MNVLAVGAHHDDIELGCAGALARLKSEGHLTFGITLTNSETHYDIRSIHRTNVEAKTEAQSAANLIGLKLVEIEKTQRDNGTLTYDVQLMRQMEQFIMDNKITMVFSHWQYDLNTDHEAAAKMTIVAARHVPGVLMYRSNWYQPAHPFNGIFFVDISETIEQKIKSLQCYESEIRNRGQEWIDSFLDYNRSCGFSIDKKYAEVFEPVKYELFRT
jgi:LmbE family N-acetylglucosaminyl deacetylase